VHFSRDFFFTSSPLLPSSLGTLWDEDEARRKWEKVKLSPPSLLLSVYPHSWPPRFCPAAVVLGGDRFYGDMKDGGQGTDLMKGQLIFHDSFH